MTPLTIQRKFPNESRVNSEAGQTFMYIEFSPGMGPPRASAHELLSRKLPPQERGDESGNHQPRNKQRHRQHLEPHRIHTQRGKSCCDTCKHNENPDHNLSPFLCEMNRGGNHG